MKTIQQLTKDVKLVLHSGKPMEWGAIIRTCSHYGIDMDAAFSYRMFDMVRDGTVLRWADREYLPTVVTYQLAK